MIAPETAEANGVRRRRRLGGRAARGRPLTLLLRLGCAAALVAVAVRLPAQQTLERYDLLVVGGRVIDGTGAPARMLDIGIRGERIVALAPALTQANAARVLDASGLTVTPGFVDFHADLRPLLSAPQAESALRQGVTLLVGGHGGASPLPLAPYLDSLRQAGPAVNFGHLAGLGDVRLAVLGLDPRAPSPAELARLRSLLAEALGAGALGLAAELSQLPGTSAGPDELVALARVAADSGASFVVHLRDRGTGIVAAVREALEIGRRASAPLLLAGHGAIGPEAWGLTAATLALVDSARAAGTDVMLDGHPYTALTSGIDSLLPGWALDGGSAGFQKRLADTATADRMLAALVRNIGSRAPGSAFDRVQFTGISWDTQGEGKTLTQLAECRNLEPVPENGARVVLEAALSGQGTAVYPLLSEADVRRVLAHPFTIVASGSRLAARTDPGTQPGAYGTFPRVLGHYVRGQRLLPLEAAIRKMTQLPAQRLGLHDRGVLRVGAYADVVVLDAERVQDRASYSEPHRHPVGISAVIVNGALVLQDGELTGVRSGQLVRRPPR